MAETVLVKWYLHHQSISDCPECSEMNVEDLGEFSVAEGDEITCCNCGHVYELGEQAGI
jgi:hypothetical protein